MKKNDMKLQVYINSKWQILGEMGVNFHLHFTVYFCMVIYSSNSVSLFLSTSKRVVSDSVSHINKDSSL